MNEEKEIINPFKQNVKTNWAERSKNKFKIQKSNFKLKDEKNLKVNISNKSSNKVKRITKSFKIYPGNIIRDFEKRVNKLQVIFDDEGKEKDYVDNGKYLMFLMSFAEKYKLYELYCEVDKEGEFKLDKEKIKKFVKLNL